jgi:FkbM family methyltransferase
MLKVEILLKELWNNLIKKFGRGYRFLLKIDFIELLEHYYPKGTDFYIIQIGANDGISHDIIYSFITSHNTKGILIEPIKDYYLKLCDNYKNYPNIIKLNVAIHPTEKEVRIFRVRPEFEADLPEWANGIASLNKEHHLKLGIPSEAIVEEIVQAISFSELIRDFYSFPEIDLIQIDTEGFDFEILKMIDFSKYKPNIIKFENCNLTVEDYNSAKQLLKKNGYILITLGNDTIALNKNL